MFQAMTALPAMIRRNAQRAWEASLGLPCAWLLSALGRADISLFHQFDPPPSGGGHQFLRALQLAVEQRGFVVECNTISPTSRACLLNSFNFDAARLRLLRRPRCRIVHRVDGPIGMYRGFDDGTDSRILSLNRELAQATVFQSRFSMEAHQKLGYDFVSPIVIPNTPAPSMFSPEGRVPFSKDRPIRLISASWSDNPNKGTAVYEWLDRHLDARRFEYTFVGRSKIPFRRIRMVAPVPSDALAGLLRSHDIFITASKNDPCSNALLEALACGLPAVYLKSGGHPEIVGEAGLGFSEPEEIPFLLERITSDYHSFQEHISLASIHEVADRYLAVLLGGGAAG